jgi:haloacetate dehalogenase
VAVILRSLRCSYVRTYCADEGGPLALWRDFADDVQGGPVNGGHFFPEEHSAETAQALRRFFASTKTPLE